MLFTTTQYLIFLPCVVALFWLLPKALRLPMLLVASYVFYMSWIPQFIALILPMTFFNWLWGAFMYKHPERRRMLLGLGIGVNLVILAVFKYANFAVGTASAFDGLLTHRDPHWAVHVILPLGISFFTFEFIHYLFEIYRGNKPVGSFVLFALFAAFFPTQIAGPVKRYPDFVAQMLEERKLRLSDFDEGVPLIITGMAKKLLIANNLSTLVQVGFAAPSNYGAPELWLFAYAFAFQIYFDFSAYTDIGRGSAMLFGYHIPINFNLPFIASNMADFWKRWHISLSSWLRDYLFIPLGGSRNGRTRAHLNIFITMALGGLWHGASWNFVVWGIYHGVCLIAHKEFTLVKAKLPVLDKFWQSKVFNLLSIFATFNAVAVGCVFFGMSNINMAFSMIKRMLLLHPIFSTVGAPHSFLIWRPELPLAVPVTLSMAIVLIILNYPLSRMIEKNVFAPVPVPVKAIYWSSLVVLMIMFSTNVAQPFIYFQF